MEVPINARTERFWDRMARNYDREERKEEGKYRRLTDTILDHVKLTDRVLDFGCGTGLVTNEIAQHVHAIDAIDISSEMLNKAKEKAEIRGIPNINYMKASIQNNALEEGTYDFALALYVLHLVEDPFDVLRRMKKLLKPGGAVISVTPCMLEKPLLNWFLSLMAKMGIIPAIQAMDSEALELLFIENGYEIISHQRLHGSASEHMIIAR